MFLISDEGREAAARLRGLEADRRLIEDLRSAHGVDEAAALVDQERGRQSLARRHDDADDLHCTALGAQQASGGIAATHRARRLDNLGVKRIVEVGCGLGLDTRALAAQASVCALDLDRARLLLAKTNTYRLHPDADALFVQGGLDAVKAEGAVIYADPDRRPKGRRVHDPEEGSPPLSALLDMGVPAEGLVVKLAPAADPYALAEHGEVEFVSVGRELKEILLWVGGVAGEGRRVSLPEFGAELRGRPGEPAPPPAERLEPGAWLWDPDPALSRSGLTGLAFAQAGGRPIADGVVYGIAPKPSPDKWFRSERLVAVFGPGPKEVRRELKARGIGRVRTSRRDFALSPEDFVKRLRLDGGGKIGRLHLTRTGEGPRVLLTELDLGQA